LPEIERERNKIRKINKRQAQKPVACEQKKTTAWKVGLGI
jgi:hypothetical protein